MIQELLIAGNIEPWDLPCVSMSEKFKLPDTPGVYFAVRGRVVVYVGVSEVSLKRRWASHHRTKTLEAMGGVSIAYCEYRGEDVKDIEARLIDIFMPKLNNEPVDPIPLNSIKVELAETKAELTQAKAELERVNAAREAESKEAYAIIDAYELQTAVNAYQSWVRDSLIPCINLVDSIPKEIETLGDFQGGPDEVRSVVDAYKDLLAERFLPPLVKMHNDHAIALKRLGSSIQD
jgi:hypothetical protein